MSYKNSEQERKRLEILYMAMIDGEATDNELRELEHLRKQYPDVYNKLQNLKTVKELTMKVKFKEPPDEIWDRYWLRVYNRLERGIGWILFSVGAIALIAYGLIEFINSLLADTELVWWVKGAIFVLAAGAVILIISVIREKLFLYQSERYKDIKR